MENKSLSGGLRCSYNEYVGTIKKYSLLVFDWDQTLWNSWDLHVAGVWHAADLLGLPRTPVAEIAPHYSMPIIRHIGEMFPHHTQAVHDIYQEFYKARMFELGHLYEGVSDALAQLKGLGYTLAVMSDKRARYGAQEAVASNVAKLFDSLHFREENGIYKPDPRRLRVILDELAVPSREALVVGDSHVDVECARNAGASSAAALWGSVNPDATLSQRPNYVWKSVKEMLEALETEAGPLAQTPAGPLSGREELVQ